jgi:L-lactate dehydrogenase complex protein LldG
MKPADLLTTFKAKAEAVQTIVAEVKSLEEAFDYSADLTVRQGGTCIAAPGLEKESADQFLSVCKKKGLTLLTENLRDSIGKIHTGFSGADYGIAETATLVLNSKSEDLRIATMLSEVHVAVLCPSQLRPDALSLEEDLSRLMKSSAGYLAFISGASRTADIERVLTIGVHGPQEFHVLILGE